MNRGFIFLLLASLWLTASSQQTLLKIRDRGTEYLHTFRNDEALKVFKYGLKNAIDSGSTWFESAFISDIGCAYQNKGNFNRALSNFENALTIAQKYNYKQTIAGIYYNQACVYSDQGFYDKASKLLSEAAQIFDSIGNKDDLAGTYNLIGTIQFKLGNYAQAVYFYKRAIVFFRLIQKDTSLQDKTSNPELDEAMALNNLGELFKQKGEYDSAIVYLTQSLQIKRKIVPLSKYEANTLSMLGEVYHKMKQYDKALSYCLSGNKIHTSVADSPGMANSTISLASVYYDLHDYKTADMLAAKAELICGTQQLFNDLANAYNVRRKALRRRNNLHGALTYDSLYIALSEKLKDKELLQSIHDLHTKYSSDMKDKDLALTQEQIRNNHKLTRVKQQQIYIISGFSILALTVLAIAYILKRKSKAQAELMMRELNHRVKNNFQQLNSVLGLYENQLTDEEARKAIQEITGRINAMGMVHRKLYLDSRQVTTVRVDLFIKELTEELMLSYGYDNKKLQLNFMLVPVNLNADKALSLSLILNELLTNVFKHAVASNPAPFLEIRLEAGNQKTSITIRDNGPGFTTGKKDGSFGFKLTGLLSKQLNAVIENSYQNGLVTKIILPQTS